MKDVLELKCDRTEWLKSHTLSDKERKELIEDKVKRYLSQKEFDKKVRQVLKAR
jgi:hypothetical protein